MADDERIQAVADEVRRVRAMKPAEQAAWRDEALRIIRRRNAK